MSRFQSFSCSDVVVCITITLQMYVIFPNYQIFLLFF